MQGNGNQGRENLFFMNQARMKMDGIRNVLPDLKPEEARGVGTFCQRHLHAQKLYFKSSPRHSFPRERTQQ